LKTVAHLRKSFPKEVTADTLRKLGVAPKNESYVINVLRFLGIVDEEGKKSDNKAKAFVQHDGSAFAGEFGKLVKEAYEELFELHGDSAWTQDRNALTQFFRTTDHSSDVVGTRQAGTFAALSALSGHTEPPEQKTSNPAKKTKNSNAVNKGPRKAAKGDLAVASEGKPAANSPATANSSVGLTVRIEVNLPASGDQETYDNIFRSIRKNLLNDG
jgi:hypothetical protein